MVMILKWLWWLKWWCWFNECSFLLFILQLHCPIVVSLLGNLGHFPEGKPATTVSLPSLHCTLCVCVCVFSQSTKLWQCDMAYRIFNPFPAKPFADAIFHLKAVSKEMLKRPEMFFPRTQLRFKMYQKLEFTQEVRIHHSIAAYKPHTVLCYRPHMMPQSFACVYTSGTSAYKL